MTSWLFGATTEGWSGTDFTHTGADGSPNAGCLTRVGAPNFVTASVSISGLNIPVSIGDKMSFWCKYSGTLSAIGSGVINLIARDENGSTLASVSGAVAGITPADTWTFADVNFAAAGVCTSLEIALSGTGNVVTAVFYDTVRIREGPPPAPPDPLRILGLAADNTNLYATVISGGTADPTGGTIHLLQYPLDDLANPVSVTEFGTANYTDPDTFVRGLYPVMRPGREGVVYLRGRDGDDVQVWYRDFSGTLGWDDGGPGTATWGTAKFAVALMPWPITPSWVIVAFSDDDVYESNFHGTAQWTKAGDATGGIRCAARSDFEGNKLLLAGTAAGTVLFSQNEGVSYTTGGTAAGTINAFDWSYPNT